MRIDRHSRRRLRLQNAAFVALVLAVVGIAAWLTQQWRYTADWTAAERNTLTPKSRAVVGLLEGPVAMTAYVGPDPVTRRSIRDLVQRYRRAGAALRLQFVNPETSPARARELGLRPGGEVILALGEREQRLRRLSEQSLTNALARLARERTRWLVFLQGHGERDPRGRANFDLGRFGQRLRARGFRLQTLSLAASPHVADNADLLVLASPRSAYLPGEMARIRQHLADGGNLLWLTEPDGTRLPRLAADLGVRKRPGVVVDAGARLYGADTPDFAVVSDYGDHPVTRNLDQLTLFPQAAALEHAEVAGWAHAPLLRTRRQSWSETGEITGEIAFDAGTAETSGPLTLGLAAHRAPPDAAGGGTRGSGQRVAVIGDGDFLSNAYLGNGVNLELGIALVNWLVGDEARIRIPADHPDDAVVALSDTAVVVIGFGYLVVLPLALAGAGMVIWQRRRRR